MGILRTGCMEFSSDRIIEKEKTHIYIYIYKAQVGMPPKQGQELPRPPVVLCTRGLGHGPCSGALSSFPLPCGSVITGPGSWPWPWP
jgi:hypothetical protein